MKTNDLTDVLFQLSTIIIQELKEIYTDFDDIIESLISVIYQAEEQEAVSIFHKYSRENEDVLCFELVRKNKQWFLVDYVKDDWSVDEILDISNCSNSREDILPNLMEWKLGKVQSRLTEKYLFKKIDKWFTELIY